MAARSHDAIVLGTSPVLLIEAVLRARKGHRLVVVETGDFGGCWRTTRFGGVADVEGACHLLENYRGAYAFLHKVVGLRTTRCSPAPQVLYPDGRRVRYDSRVRTLQRLTSVALRTGVVAAVRGVEGLTRGRVRVRRTERFRLAEGWRGVTTLARHPLLGPRSQRAIRYFDGGGPAMLQKLRDELERHEVPIVSARGVRLEVDEELRLHLDDGRILTGRRLVATESARLDALVVGDRVREFAETRTEVPHLLLEVTGLPAGTLSYLQLIEDPLVSRVSDVTGYCRGVPEGRRVLVVQLVAVPDGEVTGRVLSHLLERRVLPEGVAITRHEYGGFPVNGSTDVARALAALGRDDVEVLPSRGDLCLTLLLNRGRWNRLPNRGRTQPMVPGRPPAKLRETAAVPTGGDLPR